MIQNVSSNTVIIGYGDVSRSDLGIGPAAVTVLSDAGFAAAVHVTTVTPQGLDILPELEGFSRAVIVTALDIGMPPGTVQVMTPEQARLEAISLPFARETTSLFDALELAELAGLSCRVSIVAVQPQQTAPGLALSPALHSAVQRITAAVRELVEV